MKVFPLFLFSWLLLLGCTQEPSQAEEPPYPTLVVLLADTSQWGESWRNSFEAQLPIPYRLVVSSTKGETPAEVIKRLPWLLQPGVDELYVVKSAWEKAWLDSLTLTLPDQTQLKGIVPD